MTHGPSQPMLTDLIIIIDCKFDTAAVKQPVLEIHSHSLTHL